ncbi:hypothetical protein P9D43_22880 [Neobacillus niacini]|nr:hypothetical protein [Neobacillus niacini]MEC1524852.1 hypothetical protein [Neobacillus niacini]
MENENTGAPNTIKSSIWNTRTDEPVSVIKDKIAVALEKPIQKSKTRDKN